MPEHPDRAAIAALFDPEVPDDVAARLLDRLDAVQRGLTPEPCPEEDKPYLARHTVGVPK